MNMAVRDLQTSEVHLPEAHTDPVLMAQLARRSPDCGLFDNVGVPFCMTVEAEAYGALVDLGNESREPRVTQYPIESIEDWDQLKSFDLTKGRLAVVLEALRILKSENLDTPIVGNLTGPISVASSVLEPIAFYKALRRKPQLVHNFLNRVTSDSIDFALAQIEAGADLIAVSDPSGTGEILGPELFSEFCVSYLNQIVDAVHEKGKPCLVHICGHMNNVFKEMDEVRADALSFDSCVPMKQAKAHLPGRVLVGNVSTYALEYATPEEIKNLTRNCLKSGSSILAPACGMGMHSPLDNIKAIREALEDA